MYTYIHTHAYIYKLITNISSLLHIYIYIKINLASLFITLVTKASISIPFLYYFLKIRKVLVTLHMR